MLVGEDGQCPYDSDPGYDYFLNTESNNSILSSGRQLPNRPYLIKTPPRLDVLCFNSDHASTFKLGSLSLFPVGNGTPLWSHIRSPRCLVVEPMYEELH